METRDVTQIKVFKLILMPKRAKAKGDKFLVAISFSKEELLNWYRSQMAEKVYEGIHPDSLKQIQEHNSKEGAYQKKYYPIRKIFKIGSPLEWFRELLNPIETTSTDMKYAGIIEVWMTPQEFHNEFNYMINCIKKKVHEVGGQYLGYTAKYTFESIPVPELVGITPDFLKEIENLDKKQRH